MASDPEARAPLLPALVPDPEAQQERGGAQLQLDQPPEHWTRRTARQVYSSLSNLGTSVFFGILSAFGFKTIGQSVAIAVVLLFLGFQVLSYYGFINATAVSGAVVRRLDLNGDGQLNVKDVGVCCHRAGTWVLSWGLPSALGFILGFWFGWRIL